jgi:hypothetical protein
MIRKGRVPVSRKVNRKNIRHGGSSTIDGAGLRRNQNARCRANRKESAQFHGLPVSSQAAQLGLLLAEKLPHRRKDAGVVAHVH